MDFFKVISFKLKGDDKPSSGIIIAEEIDCIFVMLLNNNNETIIINKDCKNNLIDITDYKVIYNYFPKNYISLLINNCNSYKMNAIFDTINSCLMYLNDETTLKSLKNTIKQSNDILHSKECL